MIVTFSTKNNSVLVLFMFEILTNIINFEQLAPGNQHSELEMFDKPHDANKKH